jgi:GNAT superfamily N-acetyltransferase
VTRPDAAKLFRVLEATWRPAATRESAGWVLREGNGGGKRASAGTAGPAARACDAPRLVQIRPWDICLDAELGELGYCVIDETVLYISTVAALRGTIPHGTAYWSSDRLAIMEEIWAAGGIGPGRLAVMDRALQPKTGLICRVADRAAGVGFAAIAEGVVMVHAIEVLPDLRRKGAGRLLMRAAANWAGRRNVEWLALAVTAANTAARSLYEGLGMAEVARYHYRVRES